MLTWNKVLKRIKTELCLPNHVLEKTDEEIKEYLTESALDMFADYFPDTIKIPFDTTDENIKVPDKQGEFYLIDPDDRSIIEILTFAVRQGTDIIFGRPIIPVLSWPQVPINELGNYTADNSLLFSQWNFNFEFKHPNIIRISPLFTEGYATIEYERTHNPDLSTVPTIAEHLFIDLALGMFMKNIGRIRTRYRTIRTAFGEIELNGEDLKSEGTEIYNKAEEDLKRVTLANVILDRG